MFCSNLFFLICFVRLNNLMMVVYTTTIGPTSILYISIDYISKLNFSEAYKWKHLQNTFYKIIMYRI